MVDFTLNGNGSSDNPLMVANPFTEDGARIYIANDDTPFKDAGTHLGDYTLSNDKMYLARNTVRPGHSRSVTWEDYTDPNYLEEVDRITSPDDFSVGQFIYERRSHSFWIIEFNVIDNQKQWGLHTPTGWNIHNVYRTDELAEEHVKAVGDIFDISGNIRRVSAYTPATEDQLVPIWDRITVTLGEISDLPTLRREIASNILSIRTNSCLLYTSPSPRDS